MGLRLDVIAHFLQHLGNQVSQSVVPHIGVPSKMTRKEVVNVAWLTTAANSWHVRDCPVVAKVQRMSFLYQAVMLWNRFYKRLITPFTIPVHHSYISRHNLTQAESIHYDYSTKVATLKSKLLVFVFETQLAGDCSSWQSINHTFIQ